MKGTKFLNLKQDAQKLVITHKSCLIDESFLKTYTYYKQDQKPIKSKKTKKKDRSKVYEVEKNVQENENKVERNPFEDDEEEHEPSNPEEFKMNESQEKSDILKPDEAFIQDDESNDVVQVPRESNQFSAKSFKQQNSMQSEVRLQDEEDEGSNYYDDVEPSQDAHYTESEAPLINQSSQNEGNLGDMADQENEYEDEEEESENEGGEDSIHRSDLGSQNLKNSKNDEEDKEAAYDPSYNVFTTENRKNTTMIRDKDRENAKSVEIEDFDDYFRKNVSSDLDDIRKIRTEKLVPPNEIKATEKEEARIREFEQKVIRAQEEEIRKKHTRKTLKTTSAVDTKSMTKEQLHAHREKERVEYYRENIKKKMPVLEITAIEFDWIFGKQGADFLDSLTESNTVDIFSLKIIKEIITFFWGYFKIRIIFAMLIPFIINLCTFLGYTTYWHWDDRYKGKNLNEWRVL